MMQKIEQHYPGDAVWDEFIEVVSAEWSRCGFQDDLVEKLDGRKRFAQAIYHLAGNRALYWIHQPIAALDGLTPVECLATKKRRRRLKTLLLRSP
jgi:hypothetical protein